MKNLIRIVFLMALVFFAVGCEKEDNIEWRDSVDICYFMSRGFNIQFKELYLVKEDIMSDNIDWQSYSDITLNIGGIIFNTDDIITIAEEKNYPGTTYYQPVLVNCDRVGMSFSIVAQSTWQNNSVTHEYKGTCFFATEAWHEPDTRPNPFNDNRPGTWARQQILLAEFEIRKGIMVLSLPAQYQMGIVDPRYGVSMPLQGSEVQRIIDTGVEGVDWEYFTKDGKVLIRIKNNLYERRFNNFVYYSIADNIIMQTWLRSQYLITFEILDWDEITEPYIYRINGEYVERRDIPAAIDLGGFKDLDYIHTPIPWCQK